MFATSTHAATMPMAVPDTVSLTRLVLTVLVFLYSLAHLLLAIVASLAWTSAQRFVGSHECWLGGREYCGFVRWGLYLFISIASLVSCVTAAGMGAAGMRALSLPSTSASRYTSPAPGLASSFDPAYILRGVLLTLAFLAPLVYLGWQDVTVVAPESLEAHMNTTANGTIPMHRPFEGLSGVFILEMMDKSSMLTHVAFILTHFNL